VYVPESDLWKCQQGDPIAWVLPWMEFFKDIGMLSIGYVWIPTDWLSSVLESGLLEADDVNSLQGLICLHPHTPNSRQQRVLSQRWKNLRTAHLVDVSLDVFGLYAYDSILMIAHSLNAYLNQGGKISWAERSLDPSMREAIFSPRLMEAVVWFFARWTGTYLMPPNAGRGPKLYAWSGR
jgi:hypothetical protein